MCEVPGSEMNRLLVYCYFCPQAEYRPGGVQQIVEPLLSVLAQQHKWAITVLHTGACATSSTHITTPNPESTNEQPYGIDPEILQENAHLLREVTRNFDVVLSIDRLLPSPLAVPCVLMSNTIAYHTEATAVQGGQWGCIVAPSRRHAELVHAVNPQARVVVVAYGFPSEIFEVAQAVDPPAKGSGSDVVRVPHRPDRRKGHREAIEGLARALPYSNKIRLEISWLDEARYSNYRKELEQLATRVGVASQVSFCPWRDRADHWRAIAQSCATLQVGCFEESFGMSIIESLLFGRPAVTQFQSSVREVVGPTDLLIEVSDPVEWYEALRTYWSHRSRPLVELPYDLSESLSFTEMASRYDRILRNVVFSS